MDDHTCGLGLRADERRDRRQGVEEEMRVDLAGERGDLGRQQEVLLLVQAVFDARVVPDLDRRRHAQHRRDQDQREQPRRCRVQVEQAVLVEPRADGLPNQLERDGGQDQHELPVHLEAADHVPDAARQRREGKGREVPDGFLRAQLAEPAAGKSAPDGEGQRAPFRHDHRGHRGQCADQRAGVRPGDEAHQKRPLERQIRRVVPQQDAGGHARDERNSQRKREDPAVQDAPALEDQNVAEPAIPHQHRSQQRHDGDLEHQRGDQELLGGQEARLHCVNCRLKIAECRLREPGLLFGGPQPGAGSPESPRML